MNYQPINYKNLSSRQQESYNFQKVSGVLADYGFKTILLSDDWNGTDFLAVHVDGQTILKVQLKGRFTFAKKYLRKGLHICFRDKQDWFIYSHDELFEMVSSQERIANTKSWTEEGVYTFSIPSEKDRLALSPYRLEQG